MEDERGGGLLCWGLCSYFRKQHSGCRAGEKHCRWMAGKALAAISTSTSSLGSGSISQCSRGHITVTCPFLEWTLTHQTLCVTILNFKNVLTSVAQRFWVARDHLNPFDAVQSSPFSLGSEWCKPKCLLSPCSLGSLIFWDSCSDGIAGLYFKGTAGNVWYSQSSSWARSRIILESCWGRLVGLNWHTPYKGKLVNQERKHL